ncbi:Molybdopterin or thiamine biosynthesis adenylyltransferase [Roseovarius nanhaiticus]|uniref:Molybdopterin-synthase adenylyltransferase n=1 Tax=Roseovarius nanhaiticus TaxID=573024 RepID=A0A1N7GXZ8_9RHOB|nr:molybdopterin-synthase adenylyltransferase MoeB [Roseovarius nanhaiticus]SEL20113.1 Molybdopterin or thiamine biosynthesis adenylyltransferase [Roseovarius nanhaiticus]SIS17463.1 Molybdopterin or thiamine biosynthesis adenylyltransferase [Roseovarius nanhaiticus]
MLFVLILGGALWGLGAVLGTPRQMRWTMIGMLWVGVVLLHLVLPAGSPLRVATGESAAPWLLLGGLAALILAYRAGLRRVRGRAEAAEARDAPEQSGAFSDVELERYARHIVLREVGGPGQRALKDARVLVIGAGGLGAPALTYLAAAGVGTIGVIDDDVVDLSNLQRQVIHRDRDIGMPKVHSAAEALRALNPHVTVRPYERRLTEEISADLIADYDMVLDGCDNSETRHLVNRMAVAAGKPLISGALTQWEGQLSVFDPAEGAPCYACVFPEVPAAGLAPSCAEAGVIGPLPGVIGSMMAGEAVKLITGAGAPLRGTLFIYDALYSDARRIKTERRRDCAVCGAKEDT